jgi:hypothetical protein
MNTNERVRILRQQFGQQVAAAILNVTPEELAANAVAPDDPVALNQIWSFEQTLTFEQGQQITPIEGASCEIAESGVYAVTAQGTRTSAETSADDVVSPYVTTPLNTNDGVGGWAGNDEWSDFGVIYYLAAGWTVSFGAEASNANDFAAALSAPMVIDVIFRISRL